MGPMLRLWIGGEPVPAMLWDRLSDLSAEGVVDALNVYGITEATVDSTCAWIFAREAPHIGVPLPGTTVRVLDQWMRAVPNGVVAELYICGPSLARGYANRPGLTAARFVPDPFAAAGGRMYRSGDRARWTRDGTLELLGRQDDQLKVRGYRIEPGEIEAVVVGHPAVAECVVLGLDGPAGVVPAAFIETKQTLAVDDLRTYVEQKLPAWMRPATYTFLAEMPRTQGGKLDRSALAKIARSSNGSSRDADGGSGRPKSTTEELIAHIWSEVLGVDHVAGSDNFFYLGGHSLLAIRVVARLKRKAQLTIPLTAVFERPVLRDLAQYVEDALRDKLRSSVS
jgi:acyl-coenzyme A synthetase/AMP-(fatty) acid ligase/acyl carrier protein